MTNNDSSDMQQKLFTFSSPSKVVLPHLQSIMPSQGLMCQFSVCFQSQQLCFGTFCSKSSVETCS